MKYIILYYPYEYVLREDVGSGVRPANILKAFQDHCDKENKELIFIYGSQKERKKELSKLKKIPSSNILYTYIEFPNIPLLLSDDNHIPTNVLVDYKFFNFLNNKKIPVGGFYRDIYWDFNEVFPMRGLKAFILRKLHRINLMFIKKHMDYVFLPSDLMNKYVKIDTDKHVALPSGGIANIKYEIKSKENSKLLKGIYVGTLHENANIKNMLKAYSQINKDSIRVELIFICREREYEENKEMFEDVNKEKWFQMYHLSGNELAAKYLAADFAMLPYERNQYNDFSMPVKVFEYLSFGLPILTTNNIEVTNFVEENNCGISTGDKDYEIIEGIKKIIFEIEKEILNKTDIYEMFIQNHTWDKRIEKIEETLLKHKR